MLYHKYMQINEVAFFTELLKTNSQVNGSCIEWTGKLNAGGYGYIYAYKKSWLSHRVAFLLHNGHLPANLYICHKCNNKKCINPEHVYAGTAKQNNQDFKNSDYYDDVMLRRKVDSERYRRLSDEYSKSYITIKLCELKFLIQFEVEKHFELLKSRMSYELHKTSEKETT